MMRWVILMMGFFCAAGVESVSFPKTKYSFTVQENSPVSTIVGQVRPSGNVVDLKLLGADYFSIENPTGNILTTRSLNYETRSEYVLLVVAAGQNSAISSATVVVDVIDVNETPIFHQSSYAITVPSNIKLDSSILTTMAVDEDRGMNGLIEYSITDSSPYFTINPYFGQITVTKNPPPENVYILTVQATDHGAPSKAALAAVHISVRSGKFPSHITRQIIPKTSFDVTVMENTAVGTNILNLGQTLTCSPGSNYNIHDAAGKFTLSSDKWLMVAGHLDFETTWHYDLMITSLQNSSCSTGTPINVRIHVQDVNDYPPMFFGVLSPLRLPASLPVRRVLYTVNAWDGDEPNTENSRVVYSIVSGRSDVFTMNAATGELSTKSTMTTGTNYRLRFQATDHGNPPLTGYTDMDIEVFTPSTGQPEFRSGFKIINMLENLPSGTVIATVSAAPRQSDDVVTYSIIGSTAQQLFTINSTSGAIKTQSVFDRETTERTALIVRATNQRDVSLNADLMINVIIADVNDNAPTFPFRYNLVSVPSHSVSGAIVYLAQAYDPDSQSQMVYSITGGNEKDVFQIEYGNNVMLNKSLTDVSNIKSFDLTLTVSDGRFYDSTLLRVNVH